MASSDNKTQDKVPASEQTKAEETQKPTAAAALGEDDEFEDFPVDGTMPHKDISLFNHKVACQANSLCDRLGRGRDGSCRRVCCDATSLGGELG